VCVVVHRRTDAHTMSFSGAVKLVNISDFISPSQACIKPLLVKPVSVSSSVSDVTMKIVVCVVCVCSLCVFCVCGGVVFILFVIAIRTNKH